MNLFDQKAYLSPRNGFAIMFALIIGTVMLILAVSLFTFSGHQHQGIQNIVNGEIAHFLAEAGINSCIGTVREAISREFNNGNQQSKLKQLLLQPGDIEDTSINDLLDDTWNAELESFAREVDPKEATIRVEVWLRRCRLNETNPGQWNDPISKEGWLTIESTATYKNSQRTLSVQRQIKVASILPGPLSKFTLHVANASRNGEAAFNLIRNDYRGTVADGAKPLICYNHATPESPFESGNIGDIIKQEKAADIWKKRGWIYLGPKKIRLNLTSGAGELGEIFHFYDISNSFQFTPIKFSTPGGNLPEKMRNSLQIPWDLSSQSVRSVSYSFAHSFVLDGFHDRSNRKETDAMYEGNILSEGEKQLYTSKSSILHLFGDARKGFQSRTRVFGPVVTAFPRFANLEITPDEADVQEMFANVNPPPLYLVPSKSENNYNNSVEIGDVLKRQFGGPMLKSGMICRNYADYASIMSRISELPYIYSYNSLQDIYNSVPSRVFPSENQVLQQDNGNNLSIENSTGHTYFKGRVDPKAVCNLLDNRTQVEVKDIGAFWERFTNEQDELELNLIVRVKNPRKLDFIFPPAGKAIPMKIRGGGMIILEQGNLVLRGAVCDSAEEALTLVAPEADSVTFSSVQPNHLNLIAPKAELSYSSRIDLLGNLCLASIFADHRFQGGTLRFRQAQDPTGENYKQFYRPYLEEQDSYWNE